MKKGMIILLAIVGIIVLLVMWGVGAYNSLVTKDVEVSGAWTQVENQFQRRFDLIPNYVETVKGFAQQERDVFLGVTEARAKVGQITVTKEVLEDPRAFARFQQAQDQFSSAISRLLAVAENYPQLKSNENFMKLQDELAGSENRIATARTRYNAAVQDYNGAIRRIPMSFIAAFTGFREKEWFKAREGADAPPAVKF
ncbi:MAG: LemA family protein [Bacteroidetes bacterium]|nr:LemA family protein [Bacteroidota bacterium]MCW5896277.1 LemA family protein [Bacteroidota bacterium]